MHAHQGAAGVAAIQQGFKGLRQFWQPDLPQRILSRIAERGVDPTHVMVEITESSAMRDPQRAHDVLWDLHSSGVHIAIDDFGTGYSSLSRLRSFPIDVLKIDGSFVKEILHDPIDQEMVRSINEIGHLTGKKTIAEFAENEEIITKLRGMGIDYAQGYGVSEPKRVTRAVA